MTSEVTPQEALESLAGELRAVRPDDKPAIVSIGERLEAISESLPAEPEGAGALVGKCLEALLRVYNGEAGDPLAACTAGAAGLSAAGRLLGGEDPRLANGAIAAIEMVLAQAAPRTRSLQDIAAVLIAASPEDRTELERVQSDLVVHLETGSLPEAARQSAATARDEIRAALEGSVEEAAPRIEAAAAAVGSAVEALDEDSTVTSGSEEAPCVEAGDDSGASVAEEEPPREDEPPSAEGEAPSECPEPAAASALPADTDLELLSEFVVESLDHIGAAEAGLLELESDPEAADEINTVFRAFHTIKGTSGFLGLDRIQRTAHLAENLLDRARNGEIRVAGGYADLSLRSCDALRTMLEGLRGLDPGDALPDVPDLDELLRFLSDPEAAGFGEEADDPPLRTGDLLVAAGKASREKVEQAASSQGDRKIGEALINAKAAKAEDVAEALRAQKKLAGGDATIRVATDRLDSLINMVGELVIAQSMVAREANVVGDAGDRLTRSVSHAGKIIRELQDLTMSLRMVPLKGCFQKMARLVRDLGRKGGKQVHLVTEGEDTEIDRNMVEVLNDPLVHMIRNAVDHGIEPAGDRQASGKPAEGTVRLRAYHSAGNVVIDLIDDGKGLDRDRILAKAADRGLVEQGREMSDNEVFNLIFHPGLSTADKITDVSGRGVGMDVVRKNIASIRGRILVSSAKGQGSRFSMHLPLTTAITDGMLVRVGSERYLLPTVSIERSFRPEREALSSVAGRGEMVLVRGELLPLLRLHGMFEVEGAMTDPCDGLLIILDAEGRRCALMVDELLGQQQVVIKSLTGGLGRSAAIAGGAILGDGRVGLILDAAGIMKLAHGERAETDAAGLAA